MREIEIKARLHNKVRLLKLLDAQGISLSKPIKQHDQVFGLPNAVGGSHSNWLRIRTENDTRYIFTLKRSVTGQLDSIEHETAISDAAELAKIIAELGFVPYSDITKTRQKAKVGEIELCVDSVDTLGDFIELEQLCEHNTDSTQITERLWEFLDTFGISRKDEIHEGYDVLINKAI